MSTTTNLSTLKINYLTQAQYDEALENDQINENELYFTPGTGGDAGHVELTQAQYDALTPSQQTDGTVYFITDANSTPNNIVDFIVEQGTSGIWTYRKWHSGIAECWGYSSKSLSVNANTVASYGALNFPASLFVSAPVISVNGGGYAQPSVAPFYSETSATGADIWFFNRMPSNFSNTAFVHCHAIGTWK